MGDWLEDWLVTGYGHPWHGVSLSSIEDERPQVLARALVHPCSACASLLLTDLAMDALHQALQEPAVEVALAVEPNRRLVELLEWEADRARKLAQALQSLCDYMDGVCQKLIAGATVHDVLTTETLSRRDLVRDLLTQVASAVRRSRSEGIRVMIDSEGLSVGDVARIIGHPRQLVKRLYDIGMVNACSEEPRPSSSQPQPPQQLS
jgi:hypothetical protein